MAAGDGNFDAMRRYLDARDRMAQVRATSDNYTGQTRWVQLARERAAKRKLSEAEEGVRNPVAAQTKPAATTQEPVKQLPALTWDQKDKDGKPTTTTTLPKAPVAVTNPESEISPAEQQARLRARMLLMNVTQRRTSSPLSGLSYRNLIGI